MAETTNKQTNTQDKSKDKDKKKKKVVQKATFLEEGYTRKVTVNDMDEYPNFTFSYRPLTLYEEAQLADDVLATNTVLAAAEYNVQMIVKHITKWDLKYNGAVLDHTDEEVVAKIASPLIHKIIGELRGDGRVTEDDMMLLRAAAKNL